jgi:hypothetical protein
VIAINSLGEWDVVFVGDAFRAAQRMVFQKS